MKIRRLDAQLESLRGASPLDADGALARRYAPVIHFDEREPFFPAVVGYTIFRQGAASASFPRDIQLRAEAAFAIEYAIWWDWDIQHLYELEHIWVFVNADGKITDAEASWHGRYHRMRDETGRLPSREGRLALHSEPGKHAFAPSPEWLLRRRTKTVASCGVRAGAMAVHVTPLFEGVILDDTPLNNRLVHTWLERKRFEPSFAFNKSFDLRSAIFVRCAELLDWIPARVSAWLAHLAATIPPEQRRFLRIAHRGASAYAAENSLEAMRAAADLGADMVEIDIRTTADDVPVVIHDNNLKRTHGLDGDVSEFTMEALRRMTAAEKPGRQP